jgi:hypothetical protein
MSLLSINIKQLNKLSLKEVTISTQKKRELKSLEVEPLLNNNDIEVKGEPNMKILWDKLDSRLKNFWEAGGRGGEIGFINFENNKKYK